MTPPVIPDIPGITKMSALDMNGVHFNKRHTVLTPELLASLDAKETDGGKSGSATPIPEARSGNSASRLR